MSSDSSSDDDIIIQYYYYRRRKRTVRRFWLHPYIERNINCRLFVAAKELQESDSKFLAFYTMRKDTYQKLTQLITPAIRYTNTNMRECVSPEERVLITLRILGVEDLNSTKNIFHAYNYRDRCHKMSFLVEKQKELCSLDEHVINVISNGMRMAIQECQYQFNMIRWNCSTFSNSSSLFGAVSRIKSRETAFLYGITSASIAYSISRACSRGELNDCNCDPRMRHRKPRKHWQWGGCSEDIHYGEKFSRDFVDCYEDDNTAEGLMNLHNNEAGRRIIRSQMEKVCKCHGMSGSCSVRVCWKKLPVFRKVGDVLVSRFEGASSVRLVERKKHRVKKLRAKLRELKKPNKTELVYLEESPDYCEKNDTIGILGTHGRLCKRESPGLDGCKLLCCGRGYQTRVREVEEKCKCHFVWCCNVICELCKFKIEEHICN